MNILPTDSPSVFAALNTLVANQSKLAIVRPNNPPPGIAGFIFDVENDNTAELESDITDHFVEDNTAVQDQIALRPETVTVTSEIAELVLAPQRTVAAPAPAATLPPAPGLTPQLTAGAQSSQTRLQRVTAANNAAIESGQSLYGYYSARSPQQPNQTKQEAIYGYIYQLWKGRQLFSVETPWGIYENMCILSASVHQGPASKVISDFSITFKKIRTARSRTVNVGQLVGRAVFQQSPTTQNGTVGQLTATPAQVSQFLQRTAPPSP